MGMLIKQLQKRLVKKLNSFCKFNPNWDWLNEYCLLRLRWLVEEMLPTCQDIERRLQPIWHGPDACIQVDFKIHIRGPFIHIEEPLHVQYVQSV